jgi:adenylylsulfate kinase
VQNRINKVIYQSGKKLVNRNEKEQLLHQKGKVLWFTGLSGSGKSTIADQLEKKFLEEGILSKILDGDELRNGLNKNLGFSEVDRMENIRRTAEVAKLLCDMGVMVIVSLISPTQAMRDLARRVVGCGDFMEVYINSSLKVCEYRDVKGLYKKARSGEIQNFTGITAPYEIPVCPDLVIDTENCRVCECITYLQNSLKVRQVSRYSAINVL